MSSDINMKRLQSRRPRVGENEEDKSNRPRLERPPSIPPIDPQIARNLEQMGRLITPYLTIQDLPSATSISRQSLIRQPVLIHTRGATLVNPTLEKMRSLYAQYPNITCLNLVMNSKKRAKPAPGEDWSKFEQSSAAWIEGFLSCLANLHVFKYLTFLTLEMVGYVYFSERVLEHTASFPIWLQVVTLKCINESEETFTEFVGYLVPFLTSLQNLSFKNFIFDHPPQDVAVWELKGLRSLTFQDCVYTRGEELELPSSLVYLNIDGLPDEEIPMLFFRGTSLEVLRIHTEYGLNYNGNRDFDQDFPAHVKAFELLVDPQQGDESEEDEEDEELYDTPEDNSTVKFLSNATKSVAPSVEMARLGDFYPRNVMTSLWENFFNNATNLKHVYLILNLVAHRSSLTPYVFLEDLLSPFLGKWMTLSFVVTIEWSQEDEDKDFYWAKYREYIQQDMGDTVGRLSQKYPTQIFLAFEYKRTGRFQGSESPAWLQFMKRNYPAEIVDLCPTSGAPRPEGTKENPLVVSEEKKSYQAPPEQPALSYISQPPRPRYPAGTIGPRGEKLRGRFKRLQMKRY
ncbi:MAG: hypothetical protein Sylvanvirus10_20 [Sylvanvirus sp.]|uniref:Uncharacterized protein n=1 Tax=Sylvanvirus sp. TaxID=2487774 RepID=A0A3G5AKJ9_9VIRU|nr:MAG: hypothetical protein Sylvanvirus10_20 [Sylvanvirus sp.]